MSFGVNFKKIGAFCDEKTKERGHVVHVCRTLVAGTLSRIPRMPLGLTLSIRRYTMVAGDMYSER